jgi:hypothetical protein
MTRILVETTLCICLVASAGPLYADSYYPLRPEDSRAVYLTKDQFDVHADGVGDDADVLQQAIDRLQETARIGVVFIPEGRYRLGKTVFVWAGIRLIGYGQKRPVFVLGKDTPGFKPAVHGPFADYRPGQGRRSATPPTDVLQRDGNIDFEMQENVRSHRRTFHVSALFSAAHGLSCRVGKAAMEDIGNQASDITSTAARTGSSPKGPRRSGGFC